MACIFCDQTPETENAVEALAAIKCVLLLTEATPAEVLTQIEYLVNGCKARDNAIKYEQTRRREVEELCSRYSLEATNLREQLMETINHNPNPPAYRGPSSSPSRLTPLSPLGRLP